MNELERLKEIGLREVARKTHIEPEFLGYIINKEFEKLTRLNAKGYVKILQREYDLDLSAWLAEYDAYLGEHKSDEGEKTKVTPKIFAYTNEGEAVHRTGSSGFGWLLWIAVLGALAWAAYHFEVQKYLQNLPNFFEDENRSAVYSDTSIVKEVKNSLPEANITIVQSGATEPIAQPVLQPDENENKANAQVQISLPEQNLSTPPSQLPNPPALQIQTQLDQNAATQSSALEKLTASIEPKDKNATELGVANKAVIIPKQKVWIGVINLENGKKISKDSDKELAIDLSSRQLIVCGNGNVELQVDGKNMKFDGGRSARFLVENGTIKQISYDEFVALNKGKSW